MPLDKQAQILLDNAKKGGLPPVYTLDIKKARERMYNGFVLNRKLESIENVIDIDVPCVWGAMKMRLYYPSKKEKNAALIFFHGGGWSLNCIETHEALCRTLANKTGRVICSPEYRLAPENKYPAAVEDAISSLQWVYDNCDELGIRADKIAVGGDSSGATQAAVVCQYMRDRHGVQIEKQILVYPATDYFLPGTESYITNGTGYTIDRNFLIWSWNHYIDSTDNLSNPYLCPLRAKNFSNLPDALVITAEYDPLRDEGEAYGQKMKKDGCNVKISRYEGMMHGFIMQLDILDKAKEAIEEIKDFLDK